MTDKDLRDPLVAKAKAASASDHSSPEDLEKLRQKFELELMKSQDAGAGLDPLLRQRAPDRSARR